MNTKNKPGKLILVMILSVLSLFGVKLCAQSPCDVVFEETREVDCCMNVVKKKLVIERGIDNTEHYSYTTDFHPCEHSFHLSAIHPRSCLFLRHYLTWRMWIYEDRKSPEYISTRDEFATFGAN